MRFRMVPIDAKMPTLAKQQGGVTDRMGGPEEAEAIATGLRIAVSAVAHLLVPDSRLLDRFMTGTVPPYASLIKRPSLCSRILIQH